MSQAALRTDHGLDDLLGLPEGELEQIYDRILQTLPSRAPIYLPTERVALVDSILGARHVRQIYQLESGKRTLAHLSLTVPRCPTPRGERG